MPRLDPASVARSTHWLDRFAPDPHPGGGASLRDAGAGAIAGAPWTLHRCSIIEPDGRPGLRPRTARAGRGSARWRAPGIRWPPCCRTAMPRRFGPLDPREVARQGAHPRGVDGIGQGERQGGHRDPPGSRDSTAFGFRAWFDRARIEGTPERFGDADGPRGRQGREVLEDKLEDGRTARDAATSNTRRGTHAVDALGDEPSVRGERGLVARLLRALGRRVLEPTGRGSALRARIPRSTPLDAHRGGAAPGFRGWRYLDAPAGARRCQSAATSLGSAPAPRTGRFRRRLFRRPAAGAPRVLHAATRAREERRDVGISGAARQRAGRLGSRAYRRRRRAVAPYCC